MSDLSNRIGKLSNKQKKLLYEKVQALKPKGPALTAYVINTQKTIDAKELRQFLSRTLPDYMIPNTFVIMDQFPLTMNGKVDRKALPSPRFNIQKETMAPRNDTESLLMSLWTQVLGVDIKCITTNFFEAGGHSLLGAQLISRIRSHFDVEMPLRVLFETNTLQEQAQWLIQQLTQQLTQQQQLTDLPPIVPRAQEDPVLMSFAQKRLWFLTHLEGLNATYNMFFALDLKGHLDYRKLQQTFFSLVRRHESLRLCFPAEQREGVVLLLGEYDPLTIKDLSDLSDSEQKQQSQAWIDEQAHIPFDLSNPLLRVNLVKLSTENHILLVTMHHIISDGWSIDIFIQECGQLYSAYIQNRKPQLPELSIQYTDYAVWQKNWLKGEVLEQQLSYWIKKLENAPDLLNLPTDYPRPATMTYQGSHYPKRLPSTLTLDLKHLAQQQGVTLNMLLLGVFNILLFRYSEQEDILIGTPVANRNHHQTEELIGLFVNTLVLRTQIDAKNSVKNLFKQIRQTALEAYSHQDIPFEYLVERINPSRSLSHSPLFQVLFAYQSTSDQLPDMSGLEVSFLQPNSKIAKFDLTLTVIEEDNQLLMDWEYCTDLFSPHTIGQMSEHFQILLEAIVDNPNQSISQLPLLSEWEKQQLLAWNQTTRDIPLNKTIVELFQQQVQQRPENIAIVFENHTLTYAQLNTRSNQLAQYLMASGVGAETLVGLCLERSLEMVIGLLGVLKAGGAYLPLEPDYPRQRLQFMLQDSQIPLLLTQNHLVKCLPTFSGKTVCLDMDWGKIATYSHIDFVRQSGPENLAYVIYTSGSTGQPKGVMNTHQAICNRLIWMQNRYELTDRDNVLQKTPYSFDVSVWEFFWPLLAGSRLTLAKPQGHKDPEYLWQLIEQSQITTLHFVPSMLQAFLEWPIAKSSESLQRVICSGEALSLELQARFFTAFPTVQLHNLYGPTEAAVDVSYWQCDPETSLNFVPIGHPIDNIQLHILDKQHNLTPPGIPGELCISGVGLARGYLNRPELTQEKFLDIELYGKPQRIYKTGDLARWHTEPEEHLGNLEYLGRIDNQIKLRGFRIELGEIEAILLQHEAIKEAVIILYDTDTSPQLLAYVTLAHPLEDIHSKLRTWLKNQLPEYMLPTSFSVLEEMPLTANGKVNRKALPTPNSSDFSNVFESPRTDTEQKLAEIWQQVLNQADIGIHDNFFERGGDSILSIQIVAQARSRDLQLSPRDLFRHQTIAELARATGESTEFITEQGLVAGEVPLTPIQKAFFTHHPVEPWHFNQAILLNVPFQVNQQALQEALVAILEHHDALRLRYRINENGEYMQWHDNSVSDVPFYIEDLSESPLEQRQQLLQQRGDYWQSKFNLENGPLIYMVLFQFKTEARLLWCVHHLVVDGVSWRILLEDLQKAYLQYTNGEAIHLPAKTSSYQAWANSLQTWKPAESYWHQLNESHSLPIDHPQGSNRFIDMKDYSISLTHDATQRLLVESPAAYHTQINDLLLTTLMLTLRDWSGQKQHLIDLESHGRSDRFEAIDLSRTVGWFTSLYALSLQLPTGSELDHALKSIKEQLRQIPDEGLGYGVLRYHNQESLPKGQLLFNYLGQFDQSLQEGEFSFADEDSGRTYSLQGERDYLIEINGQIVNGCLKLMWSFSGEQYKDETIHKLADNYQNYLLKLIELCSTHQGYTPSDFSLASLSQDQLDTLAQVHGTNIKDIYPLSPMQYGMLFHTLYAPESGTYFNQYHCTLAGNIDTKAFWQAWQYLIERHSIFRTILLSDQETPFQIVLRHAQLKSEDLDCSRLDCSDLDWSNLTAEKRQQQLENLLSNQRLRGFELDKAPLMRLQLIKESDEQWRLVWHFHHLLMDGWCLPIIFSELLEAYQVFQQGQRPDWPSPHPYRDYIAWLSKQDKLAAKEYWKAHLKGFHETTSLPIAQHSGENSQQQPDYQEITSTLDLTLSENLEKFGRQHHLTLNTLIQGAWAALLYRYTSQTDIVFGVTTSGRHIPLPEIDKRIGLFINTLPLRVKIETDQILDWLQKIQHQQQQNDQYSYAALADIQNWSETGGGVALFESLLVFENYPVDDRVKRDSLLRFNEIQGIEYTNYPITLGVIPEQQLQFRLTYDNNRFTPESMERILTHLEVLLHGLINHPLHSISQLSLLTEVEKQQLIAWNQTNVNYPEDKTIVDLFQEQVENTPHNLAVIFEGQQLTYQQLNAKANQLAHHLMDLGVKAETLVGICVERSLAMVVGLLGILKAGGAYVSLDPDYPRERLQFILEDSQVPILLTQKHLNEQLPKFQGKVVHLDKDWGKIETYSSKNPHLQCTPNSLLYVIYTSGSTGKPKGCLITHHNVSRLFATTEAYYHFDQNDVWTLFHSYAFDFSVWELWGALLYGGKLIIVPYFTSRAPEEFYKLLIEQEVTILNQTPSAFSQLIQADHQPEKLALRLVIFGGEALDFTLLEKWFRVHGDQPQLVNMYGITETTVHVTYYPLKANENYSKKSLIGSPLPDLQVWILDSQQQPLPMGISGEMYVGGPGLARAYLNRPEITKERFIEIEIFGKKQRLYKTGDLARYLPDTEGQLGHLEYLGRLDHQVKLRGFRIELGEIEATLSQHDAVKEAVVDLPDCDGNPRLVTYITLNQQVDEVSHLFQESVLRTWLKEHLPEYMLPQNYVILKELPLTSNGKIDRQALKQLSIKSPIQFTAPRTHEEELLATMWRDILKIEQVGIHDNFFESGGHSLLATSLISQIRKTFQIDIPLNAFFEAPTINQLIETIDIIRKMTQSEESSSERERIEI